MSQTRVKAFEDLRSGASEEVLKLIGLKEGDIAEIATPVIISSLEGIMALQEDWVALSRVSDEPLSHFQSFDWCVNWVKYAHDPATEELTIIPIWKSGELVALLPMMITTERFGLRVMRYLGEPLIEYCNLLINKQKISVSEVITAWNAAKDTLKIDAFALTNFPQCSCLFDIFGAHAITRSPSQASTIMDLRRLGSWEDFRSHMSRSARRSNDRKRRKLENIGPVSYRVFEGGSQDYKHIVACSAAMKKKWLKETGRHAGKLFAGDTINAVKNMKGSLADMDGAIAGALYVGEDVVATEVGFLKDKTYLSYIGAFSWDMRKYSVGKIQIEEALKWSLENDVEIYDFLGEPSVYKSDWSNDETALYACYHGTSLKGTLYANLWKKTLRPRVKRAFYALPINVRKKFISDQ